MKIKLLINIILLLLAIYPSVSNADGKFYYSEKVPTDIPYQRAILFFNDNVETLIVQSKHQGAVEEFGWVIPVRSLPEVASIPNGSQSIFRYLERKTKPEIINIMYLVHNWFFILFVIVIFLRILLNNINKFKEPFENFKKSYANYIYIIFFVGFILSAILPFAYPTFLKYSEIFYLFISVNLLSVLLAFVFFGKRTDVIVLILIILVFAFVAIPSYRDMSYHVAKEIGPFDVNIIQSDNSKIIIDWLIDNKFNFDESDENILSRYTTQGWYFVTARIRPEESANARDHDNMVKPLVIRFSANNAIYPMELTGTGGGVTELKLYLVSHQYMQSTTDLNLTFFGKVNNKFSKIKTVPNNFLTLEETKLNYVTKYYDRLTPERMKMDLVFKAIENKKGYRSTIYRLGNIDIKSTPTSDWIIDMEASSKDKIRLK